MHAASKFFGKTYLKAIRDTLFSNTSSMIRGETGEHKFLVGVISNIKGKFKLLGLHEYPPPKISSLIGTS